MKINIILLLAVYSSSFYGNLTEKQSPLLIQKDSEDRNSVRQILNDTSTILCDSIYFGKNYSITLLTIDTIPSDQREWNTLFLLHKKNNSNTLELYRDSIYNMVHEVVFQDYNNDGIKDILVQHSSDVRSNWTYYLYIIDPKTDKLKKIKGFDLIKNPRWNAKTELIENYVVSGRNWSSFYEIKGDSMLDYGIVLYDDYKSRAQYERQYKKAIAKIKTIQKNSK